MRHGRSPRRYIQVLSTLVGAVVVAGALGSAAIAASHAANRSNANALAQEVAAATDAELVIVMHQQITATDAEVTFSDARRQVEVEYMGSQLYAGDINGTWFTATSKHCYSTTKERFVGLASIGMSLLPQGSTIGGLKVRYRQPGPRLLRWTIAATSAHGLEQGRVWFSSHDLILKSQDRAYKTSAHGTAQTTTVTLTYPKSLPARVPTRVPPPVCKS